MPPDMKRDNRSPEAKAYRKLYKTARWQKLRAYQLRAHPLCQWCEDRGVITPATVAHHDQPHRGDAWRFFNSKLISLCSDCHDGEAQRIDIKGYSNNIDAKTGWPTDPNHPANRGEGG